MPIISAEPVAGTKVYRVTLSIGCSCTENVMVSSDGLYTIFYIKDKKIVNGSGRIVNIVQNRANPKGSYVLFDYSSDKSSKRERIYFYQIEMIKDITPNDAYRIALKHGFVGTEEDWLASLVGDPGKSAYEIAVDNGFVGSIDDWLASLKGEKGERGKSAYEVAVEAGFQGSIDEWLSQFGDVSAVDRRVTSLEKHLEWVAGMDPVS